MSQPLCATPPPLPTPESIAARMLDKGMDAGLILAYLAEENTRTACAENGWDRSEVVGVRDPRTGRLVGIAPLAKQSVDRATAREVTH